MVIQSREKRKVQGLQWVENNKRAQVDGQGLRSKQAVVCAGEAENHAWGCGVLLLLFPVSFVGLVAFCPLPLLPNTLVQLSLGSDSRETLKSGPYLPSPKQKLVVLPYTCI